MKRVRIAVQWVDKGEWRVGLETQKSAVSLGTISITAGGRFSASPFNRSALAPAASKIEFAARELAAEEVGTDLARRMAVALPFADGSGP